MMQAPKNTKCNMVYKDYKHGLYLLELFVLWLKISKCNCTYNQCANCISIYLSCTSMPIVSNNRLEKYLCYVFMIRGLSGRWPQRFLKLGKCTIICLSSMPANLCLSQHSGSSIDTKSFNELAKCLH